MALLEQELDVLLVLLLLQGELAVHLQALALHGYLQPVHLLLLLLQLHLQLGESNVLPVLILSQGHHLPRAQEQAPCQTLTEARKLCSSPLIKLVSC